MILKFLIKILSPKKILHYIINVKKHSHNIIMFKSFLKVYQEVKIINYIIFKMILGEIMVKGARGAKVKVFFQGLHMTCVIFVLVYNLFYISNTPLNTTF